jgi:nitronate monooxygenase
MKLPAIIQGGMGVAISDWKLARAVSSQGSLGVVSGTGIAQIMVCRLMDGDPGGAVRWALKHFPDPATVQSILRKYFQVKPSTRLPRYRRAPMWTLDPPRELTALTVAANFVEVFLAKESHSNPVGINLLEKIQMPILASLYGALLAGVDVVIMGAGIPVQVPGLLSSLVEHEPVSYQVQVQGADPVDEFCISLEPETLFPSIKEDLGPLKRPQFLPIISSVVLAKTLLKRAAGPIDGLIVEGYTAGGHNAPSRGPQQWNSKGEPVYGERDQVPLKKIREFGLPFWLAGGYDSPEKLQEALDQGGAEVSARSSKKPFR